MSLRSISPYDNSLVKEYQEHSEEDVRTIILRQELAWTKWNLLSFEKRSKPMLDLAVILRRRSDELARLMAVEMGKPIIAGKAEIEKCAGVCEYYAKNAASFLQTAQVQTEGSHSFISFQPLGIILAIMPWNFPFWQVFRFLAPTLMAGNCCLLKHSSNVTGCALMIEDLIREAYFGEDVFRTVLIPGSETSRLIEDPGIKAVSFTGSTEAGRKVAALAGKHLKKTVLELGGSDPYIILKDADLEYAARICAQSRLINSGQSCIAAKRFIVVEEVIKSFTALFVKQMGSKKMGNPLLDDTELGPMARADLRDELHQQVQRSMALGAKCLLGGSIPTKHGSFYPPTVLTDVEPGMPAFDEELFGPVAAITVARNEDNAVELANQSSYGLGAAVFSEDVTRAERIAHHRLQAGSCFVNSQVQSDARLPFGGIKDSGYGRELSHFGIQEFVNIKSIFVK